MKCPTKCLTLALTALLVMGGVFPCLVWAEDGKTQPNVFSSDDEAASSNPSTSAPAVPASAVPATAVSTTPGNAGATAPTTTATPGVTTTPTAGTPAGNTTTALGSLSAALDQLVKAMQGLIELLAKLAGLQPGTGSTAGTGTPGSTSSAGTYTVVAGDSLWKIAQRFLGSSSRWMELVEANKDRYPSLLKNPNLIYPGWQLKIPGGSSTGTGTGTSSGTSTGTSTGTATGGTSAGGTTTPPGGSIPGLQRPNGRAEIERVFGARGTNQTTTKMAAGPNGRMISVTCHSKIAARLKAVFDEIKAKGLSGEIHTYDGCFVNRNKRGGSSPSTHAWGIAVDINASENPMGSTRQTAGQQKLATIFVKYGFYQLPKDPMHFQYCTGY